MLDLSSPIVMGVLNVTPDSFSDGGQFASIESALRRAQAMHADGAAVIDVGGESTRPGAPAVGEQEELDRVIPVIEAIRAEIPIAVSVDTSKPMVMRAAAEAGVALINDVCALQADGALEAAADLQLPVCLMHMQGDPRTMQANPVYDNVVDEVSRYLAERVAQCEQAGLKRELLVVDPGFGFGKTPQQNMEILADLGQFLRIGCPVLIGVSRKSTIGAITGRDVDERLAGSLAAAVAAVLQGAAIVRAHDVRETVDAVAVAACLVNNGEGA
ncbi:MAG: dihydropteroate synthase [Woeseiaceae bacterium]